MKIGVIADLHLNKGIFKRVMDREFTTLPFRHGDFMRSFRFACDKFINEIHPDFVVINGDIYDHFEPVNQVRGFFSDQLSRLRDAKIPVVILIGNHDVCRKHHALVGIQKLRIESVRVIEEPTILKFKKFPEYRFLMFPYALEIERGNITIQDAFNKFIQEAKDKDDGSKSIFFGHFGVKGAKMNQYLEEVEVTDTTTTIVKDFYNTNPNDISLNDLDRIGAEYVFLGDFHSFDVLKTEKCVAMYTGSIERNNFSEASQKKGFVVFDTAMDKNGNMGQSFFVEYPHCRPMIELTGNMTKIKDQFASLDYSQYQDGIFKISFIGNQEELIEFSTGLESLKKNILDKTNAIHIFHKQSMRNEKMMAEASKIEKEIMEKGHLTSSDAIEVVKEVIDEKIADESERKLTKDLAQEIYKAAMEKK